MDFNNLDEILFNEIPVSDFDLAAGNEHWSSELFNTTQSIFQPSETSDGTHLHSNLYFQNFWDTGDSMGNGSYNLEGHAGNNMSQSQHDLNVSSQPQSVIKFSTSHSMINSAASATVSE